MLHDTFTLDIFGFGTDTNIPDISDLFLYDLEGLLQAIPLYPEFV